MLTSIDITPKQPYPTLEVEKCQETKESAILLEKEIESLKLTQSKENQIELERKRIKRLTNSKVKLLKIGILIFVNVI